MHTEILQEEGGSLPSFFHTCIVRAGSHCFSVRDSCSQSRMSWYLRMTPAQDMPSPVGAIPQGQTMVGRDDSYIKVHQQPLRWKARNQGQGPSRGSWQELKERGLEKRPETGLQQTTEGSQQTTGTVAALLGQGLTAPDWAERGLLAPGGPSRGWAGAVRPMAALRALTSV